MLGPLNSYSWVNWSNVSNVPCSRKQQQHLVNTHIHTHAHTYAHTYMRAHTHTCRHTHTCTYAHTCTHTHVHTHMHMHAHTRMHTHTEDSEDSVDYLADYYFDLASFTISALCLVSFNGANSNCNNFKQSLHSANTFNIRIYNTKYKRHNTIQSNMYVHILKKYYQLIS